MAQRSKDDYFAAGLELLPGGGAAAVTIAALCEKLGVTKGSFYYHFGSGEAFMQDLLHHWESEYGSRLERQAMAIEEPLDRMVALRQMSVALHHEAESAIRALARTNAAAADVLQRVDAARIDVTRRTLQDLGIAEDRSVHLSKLVVALLVGMQQLPHEIDRDEMDHAFRIFQRFTQTAIDD